MKKGLKALLLVACAIVLVVATVFTTLAFLTAQTDTYENTFSVGNVNIALEEADVDVYGDYKKVDGEIVWEKEGQDYKIIPGKSYIKQAQVTLEEGSETSYLFVEVSYDLPEGVVETALTAGEGWTALDSNPNVFWRLESEATVYGDVFKTIDAEGNTFKLAGEITEENMTAINNAAQTDAKKSIDIKGYAIQAEGMADAEDAWTQVQAAYNA